MKEANERRWQKTKERKLKKFNCRYAVELGQNLSEAGCVAEGVCDVHKTWSAMISKIWVNLLRVTHTSLQWKMPVTSSILKKQQFQTSAAVPACGSSETFLPFRFPYQACEIENGAKFITSLLHARFSRFFRH